MQPQDAAGLPKLGRRRRARALVGLALASMAFHAALLGDARWAWPGVAPPAPALVVRVLLPSEEGVAPKPQESATATTALAAAQVAPLRVPVRVPTPEAGRATRVRAAASLPVPPTEPSPLDSAGAAPERSPPSSPASHPSGVPSDAEPLYRTRIPPAATWRYALRRGGLDGVAELQWRPGAAGYRLALEGRIGAATVFAQTSEGGFDAAGLAPSRYTDRRPRRQLATNFQREAGVVSFSGTSGSHPIVDGSQDRLSWLIQLAAVLAAEPHRLVTGEAVTLVVAGLRGAPALWTFVAAGPEGGDAEPAATAGVRFVRSGEGPYDLRIEVWVDPLRHCLPVRVRFEGASEAQRLELVLEPAPVAE